jgi:2-polyprenyl-3-methyl-5-hydroxy-6-metoxy-1,4-benzoquinol methylase
MARMDAPYAGAVPGRGPGAGGWNADLYDRSFGIIPRLGESLLDLLGPRPGMRVLDLGCGMGQLTAQIAEAGADVLGVDADAAMIARARER